VIIRVFRPTIHPGKESEFESFLRETALPLVSQQSGLVAQHMGGAPRPVLYRVSVHHRLGGRRVDPSVRRRTLAGGRDRSGRGTPPQGNLDPALRDPRRLTPAAPNHQKGWLRRRTRSPKAPRLARLDASVFYAGLGPGSVSRASEAHSTPLSRGPRCSPIVESNPSAGRAAVPLTHRHSLHGQVRAARFRRHVSGMSEWR
jgi:hypothetical protein